VIVAGGAESVSTAPWRVAKPKNLFQTPRFLGLEQDDIEDADASHTVAASEELARRLGITRDQQDAYALHSFLKAETAQAERRFVGEIVPLKMAGPEGRDEHTVTPESMTLPRSPLWCRRTAPTPAATPAPCRTGRPWR
jgi:acetyl-CoA C-acetyltransferase